MTKYDGTIGAEYGRRKIRTDERYMWRVRVVQGVGLAVLLVLCYRIAEFAQIVPPIG